MKQQRWWFWLICLVCLVGCGADGDLQEQTAVTLKAPLTELPESEILQLPPLAPVQLDQDRLRVVATTSMIGDVVAQVGGELIALTILVEAGQDPHSYEPTARDLTAVADAHLIFVNGWDLEETLLQALKATAETAPLVPVSAGIKPLLFGDSHESQAQAAIDPHVWLDPRLVKEWVANVILALSQMDPPHEASYTVQGNAYLQQLEAFIAEMDAEMDAVPEARRVLVTNHDALGYLAARYSFEVVGTVLPGSSTLAEPSASDLADLVKQMQQAQVCTLFLETTANAQLAQAVAGELAHCDQVQALTLYTGAMGPAGSGADSYIGMMRANMKTIADGLKER